MIVDIDSRAPLTGNYFVSNYPPFSCWKEEDTARYRALLKLPGNAAVGLVLYVHIPFCGFRCRYCYYLSYDDRPQEMDRYARAVVEELRMYADSALMADREPKFVYFGGGTPSLLPIDMLRKMLYQLQDCFSWRGAREGTFECAPKSVTQEKMILLREAGVTRISLGAQQLDDDVLQLNGRVHLTADVERAYGIIRNAGFDVVNVDLIAGLVGESDDSFQKSLE